MSQHVAPPDHLSKDLSARFRGATVAVEDVMIAGNHLKHWLKEGHPPWSASLAEGYAHFHPKVEPGAGKPNAAFDLWVGCRAIERLRSEWTGEPLAVVEPLTLAQAETIVAETIAADVAATVEPVGEQNP